MMMMMMMITHLVGSEDRVPSSRLPSLRIYPCTQTHVTYIRRIRERVGGLVGCVTYQRKGGLCVISEGVLCIQSPTDHRPLTCHINLHCQQLSPHVVLAPGPLDAAHEVPHTMLPKLL